MSRISFRLYIMYSEKSEHDCTVMLFLTYRKLCELCSRDKKKCRYRTTLFAYMYNDYDHGEVCLLGADTMVFFCVS